jgi:hypothetical protein
MRGGSLKRVVFIFIIITLLLGIGALTSYKKPMQRSHTTQTYGPSCPICDDIRPITVTSYTKDYILAKELAVATGASLVITLVLLTFAKSTNHNLTA